MVRRITLALALLLACLAACGPRENGTDVPTASPTPAGVRVLGPLQTNGALFDEPAQAAFFVVEVDTGKMYAIQSTDPNVGISGIRWLTDDSLLVNTQNAAYEVSLDGRVSRVPSTPTPVPTPRACTCSNLGCSICDEPPVSPDGMWVATRELAPFGRIVVGPASGGAASRLDSADEPKWAPTGHLLAFNGNICRGFDLFLFDPVSQQLKNLTDSYEPAALNFLWKPDGTAIAVNVVPFNEPSSDRRLLTLVDPQTGSSRTLVEVDGYGELQPVEWSPDGTGLLFFHHGGRGLCDALGRPDVPTPAPTNLETLGE